MLLSEKPRVYEQVKVSVVEFDHDHGDCDESCQAEGTPVGEASAWVDSVTGEVIADPADVAALDARLAEESGD